MQHQEVFCQSLRAHDMSVAPSSTSRFMSSIRRNRDRVRRHSCTSVNPECLIKKRKIGWGSPEAVHS